jgi:hypothetical protein
LKIAMNEILEYLHAVPKNKEDECVNARPDPVLFSLIVLRFSDWLDIYP